MKKSEFLIGFCFNMCPEDYKYEKNNLYAEWDSHDTIEVVTTSIRQLGYKVAKIEFDENFVENLKKIKPNLVFNIVEGFRGEDREAQAPAIYEMLNIPYTGAGPQGQMLALDKILAKEVLEFNGVKTAPFQVFHHIPMRSKEIKLKYPLIVKPAHEGSSIGIDNNAFVRNFQELRNRLKYFFEIFDQPALVEQFIEGREFNQAIIGNNNPILFPIVEIDYSSLPKDIHKFSSFEVKTTLDDPDSTICPARLSRKEELKISQAVLKTYRALRGRDFARIDLRMDKHGNVFILEINSIPGIASNEKENNSMPKAVKSIGWSYRDMIESIINSALQRYGIEFEQKPRKIKTALGIKQENLKIQPISQHL